MKNFRKNVFAGKSSHVDHHGLSPRLLSSSTAINNTSSANLQILQNEGRPWNPKWPGFNPNQPWSKEKCKFLHLGRITSGGYRWGVGWQCSVLLEMGSPGDAWLNPGQTKHTLSTDQHIEGLFCSPLLSSDEALFRIQSSFGTTSTKGMWRNWNWTTGGVLNWLPREHDLQGGWGKQGLSVWHRGISVWSKCSLWLLEESYTANGATLSQWCQIM